MTTWGPGKTSDKIPKTEGQEGSGNVSKRKKYEAVKR